MIEQHPKQTAIINLLNDYIDALGNRRESLKCMKKILTHVSSNPLALSCLNSTELAIYQSVVHNAAIEYWDKNSKNWKAVK